MRNSFNLIAGVCLPFVLGFSLSAQVRTLLGQGFEPNLGQATAPFDFIAHGGHSLLKLSSAGADLELHGGANTHLRLKLVGGNRAATHDVRGPSAAKSNYIIGNNPALWKADVPHYGLVRYRNVYPRIDVEYHNERGDLEYDFILAAGADPHRLLLEFDSEQAVSLDPAGGLILLNTPFQCRQPKPLIYQDTPHGRRLVAGGYRMRGRNRVGFEIGDHDSRYAIVIDPVILFSTYFGGNGDDTSSGVAVDSGGNIYVSGSTSSTNFPGAPIGPPFTGTGQDAYVAKFTPAGSLVFATYIGGTNDKAFGNGLAIDPNDNIYLVGSTTSTDFPTKNPLQASYGGDTDAFVAEFSSAGNALIYSTYLGGPALDYASGVAVDQSGNAYVCGATGSTNFPLVNPAQPVYGGGALDGFATLISAGGSSIIYSTFLGGSEPEFTNGIVIDPFENAYIFGDTASVDFPIVNAIQPVYGGGSADGWLVRLSPSGAFVYSTYIGGNSGDSIRGGGFDSENNLIIAGDTASTNFPVLNAIQPVYGGGVFDAFVSKLNSTGSAYIYSTYIGGSGEDSAYDLQTDSLGNVYISGYTYSTNFPVVNPVQATNGGNSDAFVTKINAAGSAIVFSTYLGGSSSDSARKMAVDALANTYTVGATSSTNFPVVNAYQSLFGGGPEDGFITTISTCSYSFAPPSQNFSYSGGSGGISITTTPECAWTATTGNSWITLNSPTSGAGSGTLSYTVAANSTAGQFTGTITISGQSYSVTESGSPASLTNINPNSGAAGSVVPVTITGTNFIFGATVGTTNPGIAVSNVSIVGSTMITATLTISSTASLGAATVTVTTANGTSNGLPFTVTSPAPTLLSVAPSSGSQGATVPVTLTGTNFAAGSTVSVSTGGITIDNVVVASATQITATFVLAATAPPGGATVTVTSNSLTSNGITFTVNAAPPKLTSLSLTSAVVGSTLPISLQGTNFLTGATINSSNPSITFTNVVVASSRRINATIAISASASPGSANITVTTSTGSSNSEGFTIEAQIAAIRVDAGSAVAYTDPLGQPWSADTGFNGGSLLSYPTPVNGTPAPVLYETVHEGPSSGTLTYVAGVPNGNYSVNLKFTEDAVNQVGARVFNVLINNKTVVSNLDIFARTKVEFQALDFSTTVSVTSGQISIEFVPVVNQPIVGAIEILPGNVPAPTALSLVPNSGTAGSVVPVTITGTNLESDVVISAGKNITVNNIQIVSATQLNADFNISPNAGNEGVGVTVKTAGGITAALRFTIKAEPH
jgi:hypothetical protein